MATIVRKVLDISHHNDVTSWMSIVGAGIVGIIHKATEGTSYIDDQYAVRRELALKAGLLWGAYHFANGSNVQAQVDHFLEVVGIDDQTLYALDWEDDPNGNTMSADQAREFLELIGARIGQGRCVIYSGNTAKQELGSKNDPFFGSHRLWLAQYASSGITVQASWDDCWLWQYSDGSSGPTPHGCPGVSGAVDTNSYTEGDDELRATWSGAGEAPPEPIPPPAPRPTIKKGSKGPAVAECQHALGVYPADSDFGSITDGAVRGFQAACSISVDGIVGPQTWSNIDELNKLVDAGDDGLDPSLAEAIAATARGSAIAKYSWRDRGKAPIGFTIGIALCFALALKRLAAGDAAATQMAKANTGNADKDVMAWYASQYAALGMDNSRAGPDTLRHLFALMLGLGMRESSGRYSEGRDQSASNVSADTAEASFVQTSWNIRSCSSTIPPLLDQYTMNPNGFRNDFQEGVTLKSSDLGGFGTGAGAKYQFLSKFAPAFHALVSGVGMRNLRQHWGPLNRREAELKAEADQMLQAVQALVEDAPATAPVA